MTATSLVVASPPALADSQPEAGQEQSAGGEAAGSPLDGIINGIRIDTSGGGRENNCVNSIPTADGLKSSKAKWSNYGGRASDIKRSGFKPKYGNRGADAAASGEAFGKWIYEVTNSDTLVAEAVDDVRKIYPNCNVMIIQQETYNRKDAVVEDVKEYATVSIGNNKFDLWIFGNGEFVNTGDLSLKNWGFAGIWKRSQAPKHKGNEENKVNFERIPYQKFYRGMSQGELESLDKNRGLSVLPSTNNNRELFVTPNRNYVEHLNNKTPDAGKYGNIVEFDMKPDTVNALMGAGKRDKVIAPNDPLNSLPVIESGETDAVHVKRELNSVNYGLRSGSVGIFNDRIMSYASEATING